VNRNASQLPAGPQGLGLWELIKWIADPISYLERGAKRYGDMFTIKLSGFPPFVVISDPQVIQEIFNVDAKQYDSGRSNEIARFLVGANSLLLQDGTRHKRQRKLLMPPFHGEKLQVYGKIIVSIAEKTASQWVEGRIFSTRGTMQEITLEIILQVVFGLREGNRYQQIKPILAALMDATASPLQASVLFFPFLQKDFGAWSPWGKIVRQKQKVIDLLQEEIEQRRDRPELIGNDILSLMMMARDEQGQPMSDVELTDELMTLLVAGHETTATALTWAFYWLCKLPEVRDKLLQEIDSLGENPNPLAISQLPYLTAVCQETLRIYPIVPTSFFRIPRSPTEIKGYRFEAGTLLTPSIYLVHHREDLYPHAKQFKPERFLERQYSPSEYFPFGGGNRRCLGYALAQLEMKLVLATILSRYQLALADNKPVRPQRRGLTIAPSSDIPIVMRQKRDRIDAEFKNQQKMKNVR
jgi:cytochrome P450 family 110